MQDSPQHLCLTSPPAPAAVCTTSRRAPAGVRPATALRRAAGAGACLLAALLALSLTSPRAAHADQMTVDSCHDPAGEAVGHAGWVIERSAQLYMTAADTCAAEGQGALTLGLGASPYGYPNAAHVEWVFHAPSWAEIAAYTLHLTGSYARPANGGGAGQAFIEDSDQSDPIYDYRNLGGGSRGEASIARSPSAPAHWIALNASCDGQYGPCAPNAQISQLQVASASIVLNDLSTPTVEDLSGSLTSGKSLSGRAEVGFQAHEEGPGLYSAWLIVDGHSQPATLLDSNDGLCRDLGPTAATVRSFISPTPCASSASASLTLHTASLPDGPHAVELMVDDAAGNATLAWSATIETDNAPVVSSPPSIVGGAQVGQSLTATPAIFSAPEGAGPLAESGGRWLRCSGPAHGECAPIAGADAPAYTPTSADVGYRLVYQSSASDTDGVTRSDSSPTAVLSEPVSEPAAAPTQTTTSSGASRSAVAIATGGAGGAGGVGGGASSSSSVTAPAPAGRLHRRPLGSRAPWRLRLRVRPHRVRRGLRIHISGGVLNAPRPARGKLIYLRARAVWARRRRTCAHHRRGCPRHRRDRDGRQRRHGRWITFRVLRTRPDGTFRVTHRFRLGGNHIYQLQAIAPREGTYRHRAGRSRIITVAERAGGRRE